MRMPIRLIILMLLMPFAAGCNLFRQEAGQSIDELTLPSGFRIEVFAETVPGARSMTMSPNGILYVGTRQEGVVYAVIDDNDDFSADRVVTIAEDLQMPNGVAWRDGALYIAEISRILRIDNVDDRIENPPDPVTVTDDYPTEGHHGWKYIAFGPDGKLYVPVGAPCNICNPEQKIFSTITRINPDGSGREIVARGVRNSVGFDWHPTSRQLWFTDNGRDWLGDNAPPDELNRLGETGRHFGYPFLHGEDIWDPEFGEEGRQSGLQFTRPARRLGPHVAALGMLFYTGTMFPERFHNQVFIAEHGSWNRSTKIGYRISLVEIEDDSATSYTPFIEGWLRDDQSVWGRPVALEQLKDGSVLISDDFSGTIYRLIYQAGK